MLLFFYRYTGNISREPQIAILSSLYDFTESVWVWDVLYVSNKRGCSVSVWLYLERVPPQDDSLVENYADKQSPVKMWPVSCSEEY